jgi:hypothetical protein
VRLVKLEPFCDFGAKVINKKSWMCFLVVVLAAASFAQKVKVGYDKSADFSKYKTYTWAEPGMPPTRPLLYATIVSAIDGQLNSKGFTRLEKNGDLILVPEGDIGFPIEFSAGAPYSPTFTGPVPSMNATVWTGAAGGGELMPAVADGTLAVQFVDRTANRVIWSGTVKEKLDVEKKNKSFDLASKAVSKLLKQFPPKAKN